MSEQFLMELELSKPDYNIGVGSGNHGKQTAMMIEGIEKVLLSEKPDIVLVEGDTNAVLAGALVAGKMHIPVGHVEAGLRSYDKTMPEEINRMVADVCTELYFVPTEESGLNLLFEGITTDKIFITGNTVVDACIRNLKIARKGKSSNFSLDNSKKTLILTLHRAENVDDPERLNSIFNALLELDQLNIIFPVHPRTMKTLKDFDIYHQIQRAEHIKMVKPVGYLEFLLLLSESYLVMTDSGGIQEEAITMNIPCLTLRYNTERPETVQAGGNILVGTNKEKILGTVNQILDDRSLYNTMRNAKNPYGDGKSSQRIVDVIETRYKEDILKIKVPETITAGNERKLIYIHENIMLNEFEKIKELNVNIVFDGENPKFPYPELELKDKIVLVSKKEGMFN
jgi:UDP-N-acetylglucosamine 2-epimerase (non-hydrolysing)